MVHLDCMKKAIVMFFAVSILCVFACRTGWSQTTQMFSLKDGSTIKGTLISYQDGTYVVDNPQLGQIRLKDQDVVNIGTGAIPQATTLPATNSSMPAGQSPTGTVASMAAANPEVAGKMVSVQSQIYSNPQLAQEVGKMADDPEMVKLLTDPQLMQELMDASKGNNTEAIKNDPRLQKILSNPHMQALLQALAPSAK